MTVNEFLQKYRRVRNGMNDIRPRVVCADGYNVSIQAGYGIYSSPRADADAYSAVELGFASHDEPELAAYKEGTVYPYVPVGLVDKVLTKHGGIVGVDGGNCYGGEWEMMEDRWIKINNTFVNARYIISFRHQGAMTCYLLLGETKERSFYDESETGYKNIMHAVSMLTVDERADIRKRVRERPLMRLDEDD